MQRAFDRSPGSAISASEHWGACLNQKRGLCGGQGLCLEMVYMLPSSVTAFKYLQPGCELFVALMHGG